jgi:hypothetical protein
MYFVEKTENLEKNIVDRTNSITDYSKILQQKYQHVNCLPKETNLMDISFDDGKYLLFDEDDSVIDLVEKYTTTIDGYVYNSDITDIKILCQWTIIPNKLNNDFANNHKIFDIDNFNLEDLKLGNVINIVGKRKSGKSTLIKKILDLHDENFIKNSIIVSPRDILNNTLKEYSKAHIHYKYKKEILHNVNTEPGAIIFDDCLSATQDWINNDILMSLLDNAKTYNKIIITTFHIPLELTPEIRANYDYVFLLNEDFYANQAKLYEYYAGFLPNYGMFRYYLEKFTENYGAFVVKQKEISQQITDKIFKL